MNWDKTLFFKINGLSGKNKILDVLSFFGGRYLLYLMMFLYFIYYYFFYNIHFSQMSTWWQLIRPVTLFISVWVVAWVISLIVGLIVRRPRPYIKYPNKVKVLYEPIFGKWKSMPSDHAMTCMVILGLITLISTSLPIIIFALLSIWVCWGRIYAGVHYPSDILVGLLVGFLPNIIFSVVALTFLIYK